jgi:hypothetical protein
LSYGDPEAHTQVASQWLQGIPCLGGLSGSFSTLGAGGGSGTTAVIAAIFCGCSCFLATSFFAVGFFTFFLATFFAAAFFGEAFFTLFFAAGFPAVFFLAAAFLTGDFFFAGIISPVPYLLPYPILKHLRIIPLSPPSDIPFASIGPHFNLRSIAQKRQFIFRFKTEYSLPIGYMILRLFKRSKYNWRNNMIRNIALLLLFLSNAVLARNHYTGYSGAPGSNGTCTNSCHGQYSFPQTVNMTGFPTQYTPGEQYVISVSRDSGAVINQFNASVRVGTGEEIAGILTAGLNTEIYNTPNETNGVHWTAANIDSGTFLWTAPDPGVGEVRLYWAGLQGSRAYGTDIQFVEVAGDITADIQYTPGVPVEFFLEQNYPNPFNQGTVIEFGIAIVGPVEFVITNVLGQAVYLWENDQAGPGTVTIRWDGFDLYGRELQSGVYFYRLKSLDERITKKMMILR